MYIGSMSFDMLLTPSRVTGCSSCSTLGAKVPRYRCYFLVGEGIKAAENIEALDEAGALSEAEKLMLRSDFLAIEVWQEKSFIGRLSIAPDLKVTFGGKSD